jgi:cytochrome d ubiquinol oxidase subunit II
MDIQSYYVAAFSLLTIALAVYVLLDGFDLGLGMLLPIIAKNKEEKKRLLDSIAPFWDGNEVWLIIGGGLLFAFFPKAFGLMLSGYAPFFIACLVAFSFRAVAFEFWYKGGEKIWETCIVVSSWIISTILCIAMASAIAGVYFANELIQFSLVTLKSRVLWSLVITGMLCILVHGAYYSYRINSSAVERRIDGFLKKAGSSYIAFFIVSVVLVNQAGLVSAANYPLFLTVSALIAILFVLINLKKINKKKKIILSSVIVLTMFLWLGSIQFPYIIRGISGDGLLVEKTAGSAKMLHRMVPFAAFWLVVVGFFTSYVYKILKVKYDDVKESVDETVSAL